MRVLTAEEMRRCDRSGIERYGVPGVVLMEAAGRAVARRGLTLLRSAGGRRAVILCGGGNNGGDGFVAARHLHAAGVPVRLVCTRDEAALGGDAAVFHAIVRRLGLPVDYLPDDTAPLPALEVGPGDLVVDALLGTGLDREVRGRLAALIGWANGARERGARVLAVDIPSGLSADTGRVLGTAVRADATVTFAYPKRGLVLHPGAEHVGEWEVADIGLPREVEAELGPACELLTDAGVRPLLPVRPPETHKGNAGHVLVLAGSDDKPGAAALACLGALRGGAGLVTLLSRPGGHAVARARLPEVMGLTLPGEGPLGPDDLGPLVDAMDGKDCLALGPGIPRGTRTLDLLAALLQNLTAPLILDADGLNALAEDLDVLEAASAPVVLTPHPGEMARLTRQGTREVQADRLGTAAAFAQRHRVHVVLKGAGTVIADPDGSLAIAGAGNPGMATGGTGDVLTGVLAALVGQRLPIPDALRVGVWAHGRAGDLAAARHGQLGLTAGDLAYALADVWREWSR